jgi:nucleoside-diphosphate-sugar epimerase
MILITGSSGFIASHLSKTFQEKNLQYCTTSRQKSDHEPSKHHQLNFNEHTNWSDVLNGVDIVIHTAAKVHHMDETNANKNDEYAAVNTRSTLNLAHHAINAKIKKFIFFSTIKVNGEFTLPNTCFSEKSLPEPKGPYALSKYQAECDLIKLFKGSSVDLIILRIPLVYGPNVKGNLRSLSSLINFSLPLPLPFGLIQNQRTLLSVHNLADLVCKIIIFRDPLNQTFLVSDEHSMTFPGLVDALGKALNKKTYMFNVNLSFLKFLFFLIGKKAAFQKLSENLVVDSSLVRETLSWSPPYNFLQSMRYKN